jgi:HPt (histidine-containing phosphotransfer) domain-containing protein/PAS domain-containing protein
MKLTLRFLLLVLSLLAAVGACVISGTRALTQLDTALQGVVNEDVDRLLAITHARRVFRSMVVLERDYILAKTEKERGEMTTKMGSLGNELLVHLARYEKSMRETDRPIVNDIRGARDRWLELDARVRVAAEHEQDAALVLAKQHATDPVSWETAIGGLVKASEAKLAEQVGNTHASFLSARATLIYVSLAAAALALGFGGIIFFGIRRNMAQVLELNTNLEALVAARTLALADRERALRLVLDSTGDALFGIDTKMHLNGEASAAAERWFGKPELGLNAAKYIFPDDPQQCLAFELSFDQLNDDILPWEVAADQLPKRITRGEQTLGLEYKPINADGTLKSVLLIARDITATVEREKSEQRAREQQILIGKLLSDKRGFEQFVRDCEQLMLGLSEQKDMTIVKRELHTLKGNAAIFGLHSISERCHRIEDRIEEDGQLPSGQELAELVSLWRSRMQSIQEFLSNLSSNVFEVQPEDHQELIESLLKRRDYDEILNSVEAWSWARTSERLAHLRAQVEYVAQRLNKGVTVQIEHNDIRIPPGYLDGVWSNLVHAVRNAVDHGIETPEEREAKGKDRSGKVTLRTQQTEASLIIQVCDDGVGLDTKSLKRAAERKGMSGEIPAVELIFVDGFSSREEATDMSGRGVGLAALRQACLDAGGSIKVDFTPDEGTTLTLEFSRPVVKVGALAAKLERRWSIIPRDSDTRRIAVAAAGQH